MKRIRLIATCVVAAFALAPAAAHALTTTWEVKGPPAVYEPLPVGIPETLKTAIAFGVNGGTLNKVEIKSVCEGKDTETIVNPVNSLGLREPGTDEMLEFEARCSANGPFPCVSGEEWRVRGAFNAKLPAWPSELEYMGPSVIDVFEKVEVEVECVTSAAIALYHPPGHVWFPTLGVNALKSSKASGVFHHGTHWFDFLGTDHLTPLLHLDVR